MGFDDVMHLPPCRATAIAIVEGREEGRQVGLVILCSGLGTRVANGCKVVKWGHAALMQAIEDASQKR